MNKNTNIYYETAKRLKLTATYLNSIKCLRIQLGKNSYYFMGAITPMNGIASIFMTRNKWSLLFLLRKEGFSVPNSIAINKQSNWHELLVQHVPSLSFPLVVKPTVGTHNGEGVVCNIKTLTELSDCLDKSFEKYAFLQIEEFHRELKEYRILLLKNRIIGIVERTAARIMGNGKHTINELINAYNGRLAPNYSPIQVNADCLHCLEDQGLTLDNIEPDGKIIRLHYAVNKSLGGTSTSLRKKIHSENAHYLCQAATISGLDLVGLDVLCQDINLPFSQTRWIIIEANFAPDISMHEYPEMGKKVNVSRKILMQIILRHPLAYSHHRIHLFLKALYGNKCSALL